MSEIDGLVDNAMSETESPAEPELIERADAESDRELTPKPTPTPGDAPLAWDCPCGPAHNSALVAECPTCHTRRPFDYIPPPPENLPLDERFDRELARLRGQGGALQVSQPGGGRGPGYHVPVKLRQGETSIDIDAILIQALIDVGNKAANLGAVVEIGAQMISPTQGKLTLQVEYDFSQQPLPHMVADDGS